MPNPLDIIYGIHSVKAALMVVPESIISLNISKQENNNKLNNLIILANKYQLKINIVDIKQLNKITKNARHQGIVAFTKPMPLGDEKKLLKHIQNLTKPPLILILDGIVDPRNFGACVRSATAAGVDALVFSQRSSAPITATVHTAAAGGCYYLDIFQVNNLARIISMLKKSNIWVYGLAAGGKNNIYNTDFKTGTAIVVGSEADGIKYNISKLCDDIISIPISVNIDSLNVSVASAITLFEVNRQRLAKNI